jgi:SAM-dependent methyltransferase
MDATFEGLLDRLPDLHSSRVLDIGCGPCTEAEALLARGVELTGIDQDEETMERVRERVPQATFITGDAQQWLQGSSGGYDVVLMRRPDVIFRNESWRRIFGLVPRAAGPQGLVVVTTPGRSEAAIAERWLREVADDVSTTQLEDDEERFAVVARSVHEKGTDMGTNSLIQQLAWYDDAPVMVCDVRTGQCTVVSDGVAPEGRTSDDVATENRASDDVAAGDSQPAVGSQPAGDSQSSGK